MTIKTFDQTSLGSAAAAVVDRLAQRFDPERQWDWYYAALNGDVKPTPVGAAMSGFYRTRTNDAVAVWRDADGRVWCESTGSFKPITPDQIDQTITAQGCRVIEHSVYEAKVTTGRWPDDIEPAAPRGIGDNSAVLAPHEAVAEEIRDLLDRFRSFLKSIGGKIETDDQDAKAANYAKAVSELGKKAEDTREAEKRPHLEAGRKIDGTWKPVVAAAADAKKTILAPTTEYRIKREAEERAKREAEIARQREERERLAAEAAKNNEAPPPAAPISMAPKRATGLRTVSVVKITDLPALAAQIAEFSVPDPEFVEVCSKIARRMLLARADVKGAFIEEERRAS